MAQRTTWRSYVSHTRINFVCTVLPEPSDRKRTARESHRVRTKTGRVSVTGGARSPLPGVDRLMGHRRRGVGTSNRRRWRWGQQPSRRGRFRRKGWRGRSLPFPAARAYFPHEQTEDSQVGDPAEGHGEERWAPRENYVENQVRRANARELRVLRQRTHRAREEVSGCVRRRPQVGPEPRSSSILSFESSFYCA